MIEEKSEEDSDKEEQEEGDEKEESEEDDEKDKKVGLRADRPDRLEKKRKGPCHGPALARSSLGTQWFAKSKRQIERDVFHKHRSKGGWDRRLRKEGLKGRGKGKR